jgi:membrane protein
MIGSFLKTVFADWWEDNAPRLGAALAYYTLFALAPLLIIAVAVAGLIFGQQAAQGHVMAQIEGLMGHNGATAVQGMLEGARKPTSGIIASVFGLFTLLLGATGLFGELQAALNTIWEVPDRPGNGFLGILRNRFLSFTMVLGMGFLLLVSLLISAALAAAGHFMGGMFPTVAIAGQLVNFLVSILVTTMLFAMIYKYLPNVAIAWNDVWVGAAVTALLFTAGKFLIGLYLGTSGIASAYGAASSLVIVLIWVYYSAQIFLLGAEFTQIYASRWGSRFRYIPSSAPEEAKRASSLGEASRLGNARSQWSHCLKNIDTV